MEPGVLLLWMLVALCGVVTVALTVAVIVGLVRALVKPKSQSKSEKGSQTLFEGRRDEDE